MFKSLLSTVVAGSVLVAGQVVEARGGHMGGGHMGGGHMHRVADIWVACT